MCMKKKFILLLCCAGVYGNTLAQNVGIGTAEPQNKLQVQGSLLVTMPTVVTNSVPTVAQTKTMLNAASISFVNTDSTGRIYDPGGPAGNYLSNQTANANIPGVANCTGIEVTIESADISSADSLFIKESISGATLLAVGNLYTTTGKWSLNSSSLYITFKSNSDANVGAGFSLLFRRLYNTSAVLPNVNSFTGNALLFDVKNGLFRAGKITNPVEGDYSIAMGFGTEATKYASVALGNSTKATGDYSTATGSGTTASGNSSFATGFSSVAGGNYATASGYLSMASGSFSAATGNKTVASGSGSVALGDSTRATGHGSFAGGYRTYASGFGSFAFGITNIFNGSPTIASGDAAFAIGTSTEATGYGAFAAGQYSIASGINSVAMGVSANASGQTSIALGYQAEASASRSTAFGSETVASGFVSTATGSNTTASGDYSTAIGNYVSTNNFTGSLIIGDNSTTTVLNIATANSFRARFDGGYRFFTSAAAVNAESCQLPAGGNAWVTASDYRLKEKFQVSDGEDFLQKIAALKLGSWNYISQNPLKQRHYGPMAQDFYAAFGKDNFGIIGNDTTINSADFDGINLIAIQALEKRTQKIELLEKENDRMKQLLQQLRKELEDMKKAFVKKPGALID